MRNTFLVTYDICDDRRLLDVLGQGLAVGKSGNVLQAAADQPRPH